MCDQVFYKSSILIFHIFLCHCAILLIYKLKYVKNYEAYASGLASLFVLSKMHCLTSPPLMPLPFKILAASLMFRMSGLINNQLFKYKVHHLAETNATEV